jgi:hypothetical protein
MAEEKCLPCRDICECLTFTSTDGTILVEKTNCTITLDVNPDALTIIADAADGTETIVTASTGITVTGTGSSDVPYVVSNTGVLSVNGLTGNVTITPATGAETKVTAGTGVTVTGLGTTGSPYVVSCTVTSGTIADGTETKVTAGDAITVTGLGSTSSPYIVTNDGVWSVNGNTGDVIVPTYDGSETIVQAGVNTTVTGTGTVIDPYIVNAVSGSTALAACDFTWTNGASQITTGDYAGAQFVYKANSFAKWRGNMQLISGGTISTTYFKFVTTTPIGAGTCPACGPSGIAYPGTQTKREFFVQGTNASDAVYVFKIYTSNSGEYYIRALGSAYPAGMQCYHSLWL